MDELQTIAQTQGYVTFQQACASGNGRERLRGLVATGALVHGMRGVYLPPGTRTTGELHRILTVAVLARQPFVAASHGSALALLGTPLWSVPTLPVHVAAADTCSHRYGGVHHHVLRSGDEVRLVDGRRSLAPAFAAVALASNDGVQAGVVAMDWLLHEKLCTQEELTALVESGRFRRGIVAARNAVASADGRAESPGESILRGIVAKIGLRYDVQVPVGNPQFGFVVDLVVDGCVAIEFDGAVKYEKADGREAVMREKTRESYISSLGFEFVRVTWSQLQYSVTLQSEIRAAVVRARARRIAA